MRLGLADEAEVIDACRDLQNRLGPDLTEFLVQTMATDGVEVIARVTRDPTFGPLILCGSGGTLVELLHDTAFRLHPLTDVDVASMAWTRCGARRSCRGYRGAPRKDEAALKDLLLRLSALVDVCPEVREMDLNPVKVLDQGVKVVDARVRVEKDPSFRRHGGSPTRAPRSPPGSSPSKRDRVPSRSRARRRCRGKPARPPAAMGSYQNEVRPVIAGSLNDGLVCETSEEDLLRFHALRAGPSGEFRE